LTDTRLTNFLEKKKIIYVSDLLKHSPYSLIKQKNISKKRLVVFFDKIKQLGVSLPYIWEIFLMKKKIEFDYKDSFSHVSVLKDHKELVDIVEQVLDKMKRFKPDKFYRVMLRQFGDPHTTVCLDNIRFGVWVLNEKKSVIIMSNETMMSLEYDRDLFDVYDIKKELFYIHFVLTSNI
jgi:hypothetical protein